MQVILLKQIKNNHTIIIYSSYSQANQHTCEKGKYKKMEWGKTLSDEYKLVIKTTANIYCE